MMGVAAFWMSLVEGAAAGLSIFAKMERALDC
jgi:hypothetical protein